MPLVLTRKKHETIIAGDVVFEITKIGAKYVKVHVTAPPDVRISRGEQPRDRAPVEAEKGAPTA